MFVLLYIVFEKISAEAIINIFYYVHKKRENKEE